nr:hypothetical protein [Tanacetum cinerariifolium]
MAEASMVVVDGNYGGYTVATLEYSDEYDENDKPIPFRRRVFPSRLDGKRITGKDVADLIEIKSFKKLDDDDAVSLLLYRHFAVSVIRDANVKCWLPLYATKPRNEDDKKSYSSFGFTWAFKTWILEVFCLGQNEYYTRHMRYPRIVAWTSNKKFYRPMLRDFLHSPYTSLPATTELPKKLVGRTKKNSKNDNLSPLNLGNAFAHENVGGDDVLITGVHDTVVPGESESYWENIRYEMGELFYKCKCENTWYCDYD